jgi:hypothetical protein
MVKCWNKIRNTDQGYSMLSSHIKRNLVLNDSHSSFSSQSKFSHLPQNEVDLFRSGDPYGRVQWMCTTVWRRRGKSSLRRLKFLNMVIIIILCFTQFACDDGDCIPDYWVCTILVNFLSAYL